MLLSLTIVGLVKADSICRGRCGAYFKEAAVRQVLDSLLDNFDELVTSCLIEKAAKGDKLRVLKEKIDKTIKEQEK